jgi:fatty acid desaturase
MWHIHGKIYDLTNFLNVHPGGRAILAACQGDNDCTATFESYHAMSNMKLIHSIMDKYEIGITTASKYSFEPNGFYRVVQKRVRDLFGKTDYHSNTSSRDELLARPWQGNTKWFIKSVLQFILYLITFFAAFYGSLIGHNIDMLSRTICAVLAGHMLIQWGFGVMHDASHSAISKYPTINYFLSRTWNALALWDNQLWLTHHVYYHHAFTNENRDPDTIHFRPYIMKSSNDNISRYINLNYLKKYRLLFKIYILFICCVAPGMYAGQAFAYHWTWMMQGRIWGMKLPGLFKISWYECLLKLFVLYSIINCRNIWIIALYFISSNISYGLCILPDHDTLKTANNKINTNEPCDWGEMQVRHSGNFAIKNHWVCDMWGGINYQIEHHLFPTICHVHFHKIQPIVESTCAEFNIPYVQHNTMLDAMKDVMDNFETIYFGNGS